MLPQVFLGLVVERQVRAAALLKPGGANNLKSSLSMWVSFSKSSWAPWRHCWSRTSSCQGETGMFSRIKLSTMCLRKPASRNPLRMSLWTAWLTSQAASTHKPSL